MGGGQSQCKGEPSTEGLGWRGWKNTASYIPERQGTSTSARGAEMAPSRHYPQCGCPILTVSPPSEASMMHHLSPEPQRYDSRAELRQRPAAARDGMQERTESGKEHYFPQSGLVSLPQPQLPPAALPPASFGFALGQGRLCVAAGCEHGEAPSDWLPPRRIQGYVLLTIQPSEG